MGYRAMHMACFILISALVIVVIHARDGLCDQPTPIREFEDICSNTVEADSLSIAELQALINRCDKLRPAMERLEEPVRKIYLQRVQKCRDLFLYVLESKKEGDNVSH